MLLSIIITTRDRVEDLKRCVQSIVDSDLADIQWELLIVDDASKDATSSLGTADFDFEKYVPLRVEIIHLDSVSMMVRSRNVGLNNAKGDLLLFIDDDNVIDPAMIKLLCNFAITHQDGGIFGPTMYYKNKVRYMDFQTLNLWTGKTTGVVLENAPEYSQSQGVPNVFMLTRKVVDTCGTFDESLVQTFTEPDYSFNAARFGFKTYFVRDAKTFHNTAHSDMLTSKSLGGKFSQKAYYLMRNRTILVKRYGSHLQKIVYILCFSWVWPLVYSILILRENRIDLVKLYWRGWLDGIK